MTKIFRVIVDPAERFILLYSRILSLPGRMKTFVWGMAGVALGWWIYVPCHELMHVAGCLLGGGEVHRLEIDPVYGGGLLSHLFSFVSAGGDYAGRLTGFDTFGSDWIYALTVIFPFLLSLPGFLLLEKAVAKKSVFMFTFFLPLTFAPLISLFGDFYEFGSLILFQVWPGRSEVNRMLISDDMFRLMNELSQDVLNVQWGLGTGLFILGAFGLAAVCAWTFLVFSNGMRLILKHTIKFGSGPE